MLVRDLYCGALLNCGNGLFIHWQGVETFIVMRKTKLARYEVLQTVDSFTASLTDTVEYCKEYARKEYGYAHS